MQWIIDWMDERFSPDYDPRATRLYEEIKELHPSFAEFLDRKRKALGWPISIHGHRFIDEKEVSATGKSKRTSLRVIQGGGVKA